MTNAWRRRWMAQATARDPRILDGVITQSLSRSLSFFASATMIVIGGVLALLDAMPASQAFAAGRVDREAFVDRAADLVGVAAETFKDGVRAYYFAFAALAWFFSPLAFAVASALVVAVLYGREFHSGVLRLLRE